MCKYIESDKLLSLSSFYYILECILNVILLNLLWILIMKHINYFSMRIQSICSFFIAVLSTFIININYTQTLFQSFKLLIITFLILIINTAFIFPFLIIKYNLHFNIIRKLLFPFLF